MTESERIEFGDFQTPPALANKVVAFLSSKALAPRSILEPTCGLGAFVDAALTAFPHSGVTAYDVNPDYVEKTAALGRLSGTDGRLKCRVANFFAQDWVDVMSALPEPILIVGNPPWVTASQLGALGGLNLPEKSNFQNRRGMEALTGKSNFDVAEWMLLKLVAAGRQRDVTLAMLVKTSVARRVLSHLWSTGVGVRSAGLFRFDASAEFGVSADACLFFCQLGNASAVECGLADLDQPHVLQGCIGWRDGTLVSDLAAYDRQRSLVLAGSVLPPFRWRSGVKHDCSTVMEFERASNATFINGKGEHVHLEPEYVYPLLKGSDLANGRLGEARRWLLITQVRPGEDTSVIACRAPHTWAYLCAHGRELDGRRSSIYRNRPRFSVFGVGPYTFSSWKVAISALHKRLTFTVVGPIQGRSVVFDDTCYHLSCESEAEARLVASLVNSACSRELMESLIFWDAKRPITTELLQRLDLRRVALRLGLSTELERYEKRVREAIPQGALDFTAR